MFSRIAFARLSSASWMRGKATLLSTHIVNPNSARVQIIRPERGRDQEAAALLLRRLPSALLGKDEEAAYVDETLQRPRGRRRSGRR